MDTKLVRFTRWAQLHPQPQYNALMGVLSNPEGLKHSFDVQPGNKATGIDQVSKADYAHDVEARLTALSAGLRSLSYRPKAARRTYIPKSNGKRRPLGIPSFEDRIVQHRLSGILQAIWEPEFRNCSYGFRPQRNAHQALARLGEIVAEQPSKTCLIRFGARAARDCHKDGAKRPATFNFLGFTHYVGKSRTGRFVLGRKSQRERIAKKLAEVGVKLAKLRVKGGREMMDYAKRHLQGHIGYYAVSGNSRSVSTYAYRISHLLFKWLNRRSQRRSVTWARFGKILKDWLPSLRVRHNLYPKPSWMTQAGSRMV